MDADNKVIAQARAGGGKCRGRAKSNDHEPNRCAYIRRHLLELAVVQSEDALRHLRRSLHNAGMVKKFLTSGNGGKGGRTYLGGGGWPFAPGHGWFRPG